MTHGAAMRAFQQDLQGTKSLEERIGAARQSMEAGRGTWPQKTLWIASILTADLLLQHTEPDAAHKLYESVLQELSDSKDSAPTGLRATERAEIDGRALYGKGRSLEAAAKAGKTEALKPAREAYRETIRRHPSSRYARFAGIADARLGQANTPQLGRPMPTLTFGPDELHGPLRPQDLAKRPYLLVFWSTDDQASLRSARELARVWSRSGQPEDQCVLMGLGVDAAEQIRTAAPSRPFRAVAFPEGFRSETTAVLGLTRTPSSYLVGAGGTLLAKDVSAARLRRLLARATSTDRK